MFRVQTPIIRSIRCATRTATSAPQTRPTQRLSRPIQKLGAENHMLQLNIWSSWWWASVPETCRAKNTSIKLPCCIKLAFQIISWGRCTVKQPSSLISQYLAIILHHAYCRRLETGVKCSRPSYLWSQTIELCGLQAFEAAVLCTILTILFLRYHVAY